MPWLKMVVTSVSVLSFGLRPIFSREVGLGTMLQWGCRKTHSNEPHCSTTPQMFSTLLLALSHGLRSGAEEAWRLSPNCGRSWTQAPVRQQQPLWRQGWGRQVLFPRPEPGSQEWKAGVRKLAKVGQVPLALPNPLFHPQPLETPLIPPSAMSRGVALLLQD